jgi:hypothetical protein
MIGIDRNAAVWHAMFRPGVDSPRSSDGAVKADGGRRGPAKQSSRSAEFGPPPLAGTAVQGHHARWFHRHPIRGFS